MKSRINKRTTPSNIGISELSYHYKAEVEEAFPDRFVIAPSGESIPSHLDNLYELAPGDKTLKQLHTPSITDVSLLRPRDYQALFTQTADQLAEMAETLNAEDFSKAAKEMKKITIDQKYLATAFYLLLQV